MNATCLEQTTSRQERRHAMAVRGTARRRSINIAELVLVLSVAVLLVLETIATAGSPAVRTAGSTTVRVEAGQTLWSIARAHPVSGLTTQQTVDLIARTNGLSDGAVAVHECLKVPLERPDGLVASR